ncbi:MAG: winged helix-turn-helix domain-containing protein [Candidatus Odinarchaeota archaeon]
MKKTIINGERGGEEYLQSQVPIEDVFASRGRVKILKILVEEGELNVSEIGKRARLNYGTTIQHLDFLSKAGIIQEKNFGRIRIYRLKEENIRARALRSFFSLWYNH